MDNLIVVLITLTVCFLGYKFIPIIVEMKHNEVRRPNAYPEKLYKDLRKVTVQVNASTKAEVVTTEWKWNEYSTTINFSNGNQEMTKYYADSDNIDDAINNHNKAVSDLVNNRCINSRSSDRMKFFPERDLPINAPYDLVEWENKAKQIEGIISSNLS